MDEFCFYFAEKKPRYTLEEIESKREKVIEYVERLVGKRVTVANIKSVMTDDVMIRIIEKMDELFFENKLMTAFVANNCVVSSCIENRCTRVAGKCQFRIERNSARGLCRRIAIKMMSKVFINSFNDVNLRDRGVDDVPCSSILRCFILIMEHELVHAIVFCMCDSMRSNNDGAGDWSGVTRPSNGHSKTFMSILFNVFGHTKFTHNLLHGMVVKDLDRHVFTLDELKEGDLVITEVRFKGDTEKKQFLAVIDIINRRKKKGNMIGLVIMDGDNKGRSLYVSPSHIVEKVGRESSDDKHAVFRPTINSDNFKVGDVVVFKGKDLIKIKNITTVIDNHITGVIDSIDKRNKQGKNIKVIGDNGLTYNISAKQIKDKKTMAKTQTKTMAKTKTKTMTKTMAKTKTMTMTKTKTKKVDHVVGKDKGECTKRNPEPPCGEGMVERKRPNNGAVCCYKGTVKKVSAKKGTVKKCTKRNPDPPCGEGMVARKRPNNGAVCCYKN